MKMTFNEFLKSDARNYWVSEPKMKAYVRKSYRVIEDQVEEKVIDIANVEVISKYRGTGVYRSALPRMEQASKDAGFTVIFLESVLEERLLDFYEKHGYTRCPPNAYNTRQINFFKRLT